MDILHKKNSKISVKSKDEDIAVIGLGYVGFPLSIHLARKFETVTGFDISSNRVATLKKGHDDTGEIEDSDIAASSLILSNDEASLADATFYIVTVPTPISNNKQPDLNPIHSACNIIGQYLSKGDIVVFESTVYPGVTENICGPLLAKASGLKAGIDFNLGYSPERINPGDKKNTLDAIIKNVAGDTPETLERVAQLYEKIITAGIYKAPSIKVAEAAKVLENTQRDINIALMNELAIICNKIEVPTMDVIKAASTKWNFIPYTPGLVGGHCVGVDPYYLASLSEEVGHHPEVILSGRRLNDRMPEYIANVILKKLVMRGGSIHKSRVGVFGLTFKENVPDMRNSKSLELVGELKSSGLNVLVNDPIIEPGQAEALDLELSMMEDMTDLEILVLAVPHSIYVNDLKLLDLLVPKGLLIDIKSVYSKSDISSEVDYWAL